MPTWQFEALLYLADRQALFRFAFPITTDRYISRHGLPIPVHIEALLHSAGPTIDGSVWNEAADCSPTFGEVRRKSQIDFQELCDAEIDLLNILSREKCNFIGYRLFNCINQSAPAQLTAIYRRPRRSTSLL
jgi:hypothetical protein